LQTLLLLSVKSCNLVLPVEKVMLSIANLMVDGGCITTTGGRRLFCIFPNRGSICICCSSKSIGLSCIYIYMEVHLKSLTASLLSSIYQITQSLLYKEIVRDICNETPDQ
jgi:hypothetical protein